MTSDNAASRTPQEDFWSGEFGDSYVDRSRGDKLIASNLVLFARALRRCAPICSVMEFGANIGLNLLALKKLYPSQRQYAIEINQRAASELRRSVPDCCVFEESILGFDRTRIGELVDLSLIKGVLIHIEPDALTRVYDLLCGASARYVLLCEYYNPTPVAIPYRGHMDRLFKRDFCGEILDRHPAFALLDYGFVYRRDPVFPQDDSTWFLLERRQRTDNL